MARELAFPALPTKEFDMTDSGWRKRQIALDKKAENARELGLNYEGEPMTFEQLCRLSEQCLPEAPYRDMLTKLHNEMLEALAQPAQRTWVGLTQDERINIAYKANGNEVVAVELTEAKLKELNHD